MPEPYNLTALTDNTNIFGILSATNTLSDGFFGIILLLLFFVILFVSFKQFEVKRALSSSLFILSIAVILMRVLGIVTDLVMFAVFILTGLSLVFLIWGD